MSEETKQSTQEFGEELIKIATDYQRKAFSKGVKIGLMRHVWMKDGVTYVGNGTYTLAQAIKSAVDEGLINPADGL